MRYFTPQLLERVRSLDDDVSGQAQDDWERAITRYQRHLEEIGPRLPAAVKRFRRQFCLHDAQVITMAEQDKQFFMVLQLEPPSTTTIFMTFHLIAKAKIEHEESPALAPTGVVTWMYEEFDVDRRQGCTLELLLSDGSLVKLRFRDFRFAVGKQVLPEVNGHKALERAMRSV